MIPLPATSPIMVPIQFQSMTDETSNKLSADRTTCCTKPPTYQRQATDDCDTTMVTAKSSSDGGSGIGGWLSQRSTTVSCSSMSQTCIHNHHDKSSDEVRKRYLHRLGIRDDAKAEPNKHPTQENTTDTIGGVSQRQERRGSYTSEGTSLRRSILKPSHDTLSRSSSQGAISTHQNGQNKIILLRRSVQFTTKLKADPTEASQLVSKTPKDEGNDDIMASLPKSPPSNFDLSSAWSSLLSKDTASSTSSASSEPPLDGAYDLFSLPSDSSILATSRCDSNRSLDNTIVAMDRLPSRDDFFSDLSSSMIRRRRKVSFDDTVKAATIPSRFTYSNRIRTRLWSSSEDIYANAVRNEREYVYDGKNWRSAREEGDFLYCSSHSLSSEEELMHPVHFSAWPSSSYSSSQSRWQREQSHSSRRSSALHPVRNGELESSGADERANTTDGDYSSGMFEME